MRRTVEDADTVATGPCRERRQVPAEIVHGYERTVLPPSE
jgi:hypothetical protein